jgi:hypothetical protein
MILFVVLTSYAFLPPLEGIATTFICLFVIDFFLMV